MGPFIVVTLRLLLPLSILRWPLFGAIVAMAIDALDVVLITFINQGPFSNYHGIDKYLDMYYLGLEGYRSFFWQNKLARNTSIFLFIYRTIGFVLFETTRLRIVLFIFPNLFENFYLFYLTWLKIMKKDPVTSYKNLWIIVTLLLIPKMAQEYLLHVLEAKPWMWIRYNLLHMSR